MARGVWNKNCKVNNLGFSIVELVIAVAILSIASVPLLQMLSRASKTNISAQNTQNATSVAEAAMEKVKASSLMLLGGATDENPAYYVDGEGKNPSFFVKDNMTDQEKADRDAYLAGKTSSRKLIKEKDGFYVYYEPQVSSNGSSDKYDVIVTIDTTVNTADGGTPLYAEVDASNPNYDDKNASDANAVELPVLSKIDTSKDVAISTEINKYDKSAATTILELYKDKCLLSSQDVDAPADNTFTVSDINKTVTVKEEKTTEEDNGVTKNIVLITVDVSYAATVSGEQIKFPKSKIVYKSSFDLEDEPNIYIFYKSMDEICNSHIANSETIKFEGNYKGTLKTYLALGSGYEDNGTSGYKYTATALSINVENKDDVTKAFFNNSTAHVYEEAKGEHIYEINVYAIKDGQVFAHVTSTKSGKNMTPTPSPTSTVTPTATPTPTVSPGG